ncbi:MAG: hypothetical protein LBP92_14545 [Deltaproteobacteria bacterium]|nr:hypothetical protein [Deltaproteobacteria bacterium]
MSTSHMALTNGEVYALAGASLDAHRAGNFEEEARLVKLIPMHPMIAKNVKCFLGPKYLIEHAFDLSKAFEGFGPRGEIDIIR